MFTKFLRKLSCSVSINNNNNSKFLTNSCWRCHQRMPRNDVHDWKRKMNAQHEKRKAIPRLVYLHNPWNYLLTKINLLKFRILWDPQFVESEFIRGAKQAAVVITNIVRKQNGIQIRKYTTPVGFKQITRDMMLSRDDTRLKLVRFEAEHLRRAIPMNVATKQNYGYRYCFIDMLFVGLRNIKDFDTTEEIVEMKNVLQKLDTDFRTPHEALAAPHRIVFAEIFIRFRRDYTEYAEEAVYRPRLDSDGRDWSVSFYKILTFDILNYDPRET